MPSAELNAFTPWSQPLIRWAGSKRQLVPQLQKLVPYNYRTYFEPFVGSACLYFALNPKQAVLSDINVELINAYNTVKIHPRIVWRKAASYPTDKNTYYEIRAAKYAELSGIDCAARFFYLNRNCFNGLFRTNKKGEFNVPIGTRTGELPSEAGFVRASWAFRRASIINGDFYDVIASAGAEDFTYLDPPYAHSGRVDRNEYGNNSFGVKDIPRLMDALSNLHDRGGKFLLSYLAIDEFLKILPKKITRTVTVRRNISGFKESRGIVSEVLITNNDIF